MRVGIFGGSFNPVHRGHLKLAHEAFTQLNLSEIVFVPAAQSPFKESQALLPAWLRLKLLRKALRPYPYFKISTCEIERRGVSYTVDTLRQLRKLYPAGAVLYFLAGADVLARLHEWKSKDELLRSCRFVVADRPGRVAKRSPRSVLRLPLNALNVSATQIRRLARKGRSISALVPAGCDRMLIRYMKENYA